MTAAIAFPLTPVMRARLEARETAVDLSRKILRGKEHHAPDDVRLACHTLMTYGDQWDWVEAYHVLRALDTPAPVPVPENPRAGSIRLALIDFAAFVVAMGAVGAVFLGGPV